MGQLADTFSTPASGADGSLPPGAFWGGTGENRVLFLPVTVLVTYPCLHARGEFVPIDNQNPLLSGLAFDP